MNNNNTFQTLGVVYYGGVWKATYKDIIKNFCCYICSERHKLGLLYPPYEVRTGDTMV